MVSLRVSLRPPSPLPPLIYTLAFVTFDETHGLDALESNVSVCVTGQRGIGKTQGYVMSAIQALLSQGASVFYVQF